MKDKIALLGSGCLIFVLVFGVMVLVSASGEKEPSPAAPLAAAIVPSAPRSPASAPVMVEPSASGSPTAAAPIPAAPPPARNECIISIPGHEMKVPLFPTEAGLDEYGKAAARDEDDRTMMIVLRANNGFLVEKGAKCSPIETGWTISKVRVLSGPNTGAAGWLPNEWRTGG